MTAHNVFNVERWSGLASIYDMHRPTPPLEYVKILTQFAGGAKPQKVVDIGAGTGLSTRLWADYAEKVIGIEPNADMRTTAQAHTVAENITYQEGISAQTGLPDGCADIVTISQALHWMQPNPTFQEAARILRPNGVFAAIDCDWPPVIHPEVEMAYNAVMDKTRAIEAQFGYSEKVAYVDKNSHLRNMQTSGQFRYTREIVLHSLETGGAERIVGLAISQGHVSTCLKKGHSEDELGLTHLRTVALRMMQEKNWDWYFCYRVRVGVK